MVLDEGLFFPNRIALMHAALRHALPTILNGRPYVDAGGLLSFEYDSAENDRIFAYFVDKILRGAKPADLPIQQPTKFVLSINLKVAKALGLSVPPTLLGLADEVIE